MLSLGEHYGQGLCECSHDKYGLLEWDPGCPVEGHTEAVTQVQFSDDGAQVVFTLVTGPRRSLSLKLSDTRVYEPQIRARLGNTARGGLRTRGLLTGLQLSTVD